MRPFTTLVLVALLAAVTTTTTHAADTKKPPPPFFLQDPTDSLCLSGEEFKRCSIDTLWYATGTQGAYQIHKRPVDGVVDDQDDGLCLAKKSCKESDKLQQMDAKVAKCSHCGAQGWTILGEGETGYTVVTDQGTTCLARIASSNSDNDKAVTGPCDSPDTPLLTLQLQFASSSDIATMSSPGARLVSAATDGDKKQVQAILKQEKIDINVVDWDGLNALIPAASGGHLDLCKYLIDQGIDVNAADKDGITALMEASIMGHVKVVEFLLEKGAQVEQTAGSGINAVWLAASEGQVPVVKILLDKGADLHNMRADDISVLMVAAIGGHSDMVSFLLEQGADPTATDKEGLTPLMNAVERGDVAVVKAIVDALPEDKVEEYVNKYSGHGFTPLIIASAQGFTDVIEYLIEKGADVNKGCNENGVTALMYAAANRMHQAVQLLIEKGKADVNQRHNAGGSALIEASTGGGVEAMKLLIQAGADIDNKDEDGVSALMGIATSCVFEGFEYLWNLLQEKGLAKAELDRMSNSGGTPLMFAAAGGNVECIDFLINQGATIDVRSKATPEYLAKLQKHQESGQVQENEEHTDDVTPLHVAAQAGHLDAVQRILKAGSDPTLVDAKGRTALQVAIKGNFGEIAIALVEAGSDPNTPYIDEEGVQHNLLFDSIMVENEDFAKVLIEKGADLYHKDDKKVTTLLQASHRGLTDIVQLLVDAHKSRGSKKSYLDDASDEGVTPLISACSEGHDEVVKILLQAGANIKAVDGDSVSPLMAAASRGHLSIAKLLISAGANVNDQNKDGHSALMFAYNGKNQVQTLMERYAQYYADEAGSTGADDGGTEPLIKEALANHTALVDFLLESGADATLKDKEGHVPKDFDYQADNPAIFGKDATASASAGKDSAKEEL